VIEVPLSGFTRLAHPVRDGQQRSRTTVGAVATQVGYGRRFALSTAVKRLRGISPHQHRAVAGRSDVRF
jgi:AraC-like DNA-binding protein